MDCSVDTGNKLQKLKAQVQILPLKKLLLLLFSILISFNSYGEWTKITANDDVDFFMDIETIKERGGYVYYWQLNDWHTPLADDFPALSAVIHKKIDCSAEKMRNEVIYWYEQNMGKGDIYMTIDSSSETTWIYPPHGSAYFIVLNFACTYAL